VADFSAALKDARDALALEASQERSDTVKRLEAAVKRRLGQPELSKRSPGSDVVAMLQRRHSTPRVLSIADVRVSIREVVGGGTGGIIWFSSLLLAHWLVAGEGVAVIDGLRERRGTILEVGSGLGIAGLVAAARGAPCVVLTDCRDDILANLRYEVLLNGHKCFDGKDTSGPVCLDRHLEREEKESKESKEVMRFRESKEGKEAKTTGCREEKEVSRAEKGKQAQDGKRGQVVRAGGARTASKISVRRFDYVADDSDPVQCADVVVGADVVYGHEHAPLARALRASIRREPRGLAVLLLPSKRVGISSFLEALSEEGMDCRTEAIGAAELAAVCASVSDSAGRLDLEDGLGEEEYSRFFISHRKVKE
jgi:predicted nicotinamide N-methyase